VAINFSDRILITNPTAYHLGRTIVFVGLLAIATGTITYFTGEFLMPALAWVAAAVPTLFIGGLLIACGLTKP
jgi:hypothetical protein